MALTTLAEVKAYLGIADTSQDALIEILRPAVEELVIAFCDSDFEQKTITNEIHDGSNSDVIVPYNYPVISIDAVYLGVNTLGQDGTLLPTTDYYKDDDGSVILRSRVTPFYRGSVRIDYKHGYTAVPATVKLCIYQVVKAEMQRRKSNTENLSSRAKDGESESFNAAWDKRTGLPVQIMSKLEMFRNKEFPLTGMAQRNS